MSEQSNPFRGLRPFELEDDHLFFGRERLVDQLLTRLRQTRFLSIVGSSGCGKSSLLQAGMIPSLYSGYMVSAGSRWRVAVMRPGAQPIVNLAKALSHPDILPMHSHLNSEQFASTQQVLLEATLLRSNQGLVDCVRQAQLPEGENLLLVVDQFEELFRYQRLAEGDAQKQATQEEARAFVKRLLGAAEQDQLPIYIALTMRSDFIGDCNDYPGLPEAINAGLFLVPRMGRRDLRSAIEGPVKVGGGTLAAQLLVQLLNDVGDNPDRLPLLQHALMRSWDLWRGENTQDGNHQLALTHYQASGTMETCLSRHAEETFESLADPEAQRIAQMLFKSLTEIGDDGRGVRRPCSIEELSDLAAVQPQAMMDVVEVFRREGRCFLMPAPEVTLSCESIIDLTHESLMRVWQRLLDWIAQEQESVRNFRRVSHAAERYQQNIGSLWGDPELQIGLNWREAVGPTERWAERYGGGFSRAMMFLDASAVERQRQQDERRRVRRKRLQLAWGVSLVLLVFAVFAGIQQQLAERERQRAESNFSLAVTAVDEMLGDVAVENSLAKIPQTEALRQRLLEKAKHFYEALQQDSSADLQLQLETVVAQVRLGKIYHLQGFVERATATNLGAIDRLKQLLIAFPGHATIEHRLGEAYNWYALQIMDYDRAAAEVAYQQAHYYHQRLVERFPERWDYQHELARVFNNRAILLGGQSERMAEAETSFRRSQGLFQALTKTRSDALDRWRLARTQNGLASLLRRMGRIDEAVTTYQQAIDQVTQLLVEDSERRDYREGLARFYNNLANLHFLAGQVEAALAANSAALALFEGLALPIAELRGEIANGLNTRGAILRAGNDNAAAIKVLEESVRQFEELELTMIGFEKSPLINDRFAGALSSLAILQIDAGDYKKAVFLLSRGVSYFLSAINSVSVNSSYKRNLSNAYWLLADTHIRLGDHALAVKAAQLFHEVYEGKDQLKERLSDAAYLLGRATQLLLEDKTLSASQREILHKQYDEKTLLFLRQSLVAGYSAKSVVENTRDKGPLSHLVTDRQLQRLLNDTSLNPGLND